MPDPADNQWAPIPHDEAAALLRGKPPVTRELFDRLLPEYRARAFLITGIDDADALVEIRDLLSTVPEGQDWDRTRRELIARLDPWLGDGAARRAELLMRHHVYQAYAVTNTLHLDEQRDIFPYRQYITAQDERVRPSHAALNKLVLPADSPFWDTHTPPWGWGCRCDVVGLSEEEVGEIRESDAQLAPEKRLVLEGPLKDRLELAGELVRGPNEIYAVREEWKRGPGWNPRDLRLPIDKLAERYAAHPDVWAEFQRWAESARLPGTRMKVGHQPATVWRWTSGEEIEAGEPVGQAPLVGSTPPPDSDSDQIPPTAKASPVSGKFTLPSKGKVRAAGRAALDLIDQVHGDGGLVTSPLEGRSSLKPEGQYAFWFDTIADKLAGTNIAGSKITMRPTQDMPINTVLHEVAHKIDLEVVRSQPGVASALEAAANALLGTPLGQSLGAHPHLTPGYRPYFISTEEVWARGYAQYIATRTGNPAALAEIERMRASANPSRRLGVWPEEEFTPLIPRFDEVFRLLGWRL